MPTELQNLASIFNRSSSIPDYQRGYAWGKRQLLDFWADLRRAMDRRLHYCGQLTLESATEEAKQQWLNDVWLAGDAGYKLYFVVDGQQRLTTAIILLQCLLEGRSPQDRLAGETVAALSEVYLAKSNGVLTSCIFGYAKDNPSHEFFCTQVLGIPSNDYRGVQTIYTANLAFALNFFRQKLRDDINPANRDRLFKALTQQFRFNLHELNSDVDVFVAFETMNNRGKPLSRLELLKNRLIYLSTLAAGSGLERTKVRGNINVAWQRIYEELGSNPREALDDDEFLRAHWIVFFGYDKDEADPLTQFLLNEHFTAERLEKGDLTLQALKFGSNFISPKVISIKPTRRSFLP
jgi:hypothetical protein